jgi:hypothetical protein
MDDQVFVLRGTDGVPEWRVIVNGEVVPATWRDQGTALAGLATEQRRATVRLAARAAIRVLPL